MCSEKVSHIEVDYVIKEYPKSFFIMIKRLIAARHMVDIIIDNGKVILTAESSKKNYQKKKWMLVGFYCLAIIIIQTNNIFVFLMNSLGLETFKVDTLVLLIGTVISLVIGILIAIISGILFSNVDALTKIYDDLNIQHVAKK